MQGKSLTAIHLFKKLIKQKKDAFIFVFHLLITSLANKITIKFVTLYTMDN